MHHTLHTGCRAFAHGMCALLNPEWASICPETVWVFCLARVVRWLRGVILRRGRFWCHGLVIAITLIFVCFLVVPLLWPGGQILRSLFISFCFGAWHCLPVNCFGCWCSLVPSLLSCFLWFITLFDVGFVRLGRSTVFFVLLLSSLSSRYPKLVCVTSVPLTGAINCQYAYRGPSRRGCDVWPVRGNHFHFQHGL